LGAETEAVKEKNMKSRSLNYSITAAIFLALATPTIMPFCLFHATAITPALTGAITIPWICQFPH
jgi:hypothetical protein